MSIHADIQGLCAALAVQAALPLTAEHIEALQERAQRLLGLLVQARIELEVGQNLEANVARLAAVLEGSDVPETEALDVVETGAGIPPEDLSAKAAREYARRVAHRRGTQDTDEEPRGGAVPRTAHRSHDTAHVVEGCFPSARSAGVSHVPMDAMSHIFHAQFIAICRGVKTS